MVKNKNERAIINDGLQYFKGFLDALEFSRNKKLKEIDQKYIETEKMIEQYRERLFDLKKERNNASTKKYKRK